MFQHLPRNTRSIMSRVRIRLSIKKRPQTKMLNFPSSCRCWRINFGSSTHTNERYIMHVVKGIGLNRYAHPFSFSRGARDRYRLSNKSRQRSQEHKTTALDICRGLLDCATRASNNELATQTEEKRRRRRTSRKKKQRKPAVQAAQENLAALMSKLTAVGQKPPGFTGFAGNRLILVPRR